MGHFWEMQILGNCNVCDDGIHEYLRNNGVYKECTICKKYICRECFCKCLAFCTCEYYGEECIENYDHAEYYRDLYCIECVSPLINKNDEDKASCFFKNFENVLDIETGKGFLKNKIDCHLVEEFINSQDFEFNKENFIEKFIEYAQQKWIIFEEYTLVFDLGNDKSVQRIFKCPTKFKKYYSFLVGNKLKGKFIRDDDDKTNSVDKKRKEESSDEKEDDEQETNKKISLYNSILNFLDI